MPPKTPKTNRREVTPITRAEMLGMHKAGASCRAIGLEYNRNKTTVAYTIRKAMERDHHKSAARIGAPRKTTKLQDEKLQKQAVSSAKNRRVTLGELNANLMPEVSRRTIQRRLEEANIRKWKAAGRPLLKPEHKANRLAWALQYEEMDEDDWDDVLWSDETSVHKQDGKDNVWVFRTPQEKWVQDCIEPVAQGARTAVMFWGCYAGGQRGPLTVLEPDEELTGKKGITGLIILEEAYKKLLPEMLDDFPARVFMQDNARTHILGAITDWLKSQDYTVMDWPPYSPDLNPIEMV